jgi:micrococcal nuclease
MFENDYVSRAVMRGLLLLQIAAMVTVLTLCLMGLSYLAFVISVLTFLMFAAAILGLYARYQNLPGVREKRQLEHLLFKFRKKIDVEANNIQAAKKQRNSLFQSEREQISAALKTLQQNYIEQGLANAWIKEATIPGVGPKLKERLTRHGILSAAHVSPAISQLPGFGDAKGQVLSDWRSVVMAELESTKPASLPDEQMQAIKHKYQVLHDQNNAAERKAITSRQILQHELASLEPSFRELRRITFLRYLSKSLASRSLVAALIALMLVIAQVVSSVSATGSALLASILTATETPTVTPTSTASQTAAPTQMSTPTLTSTPTLVLTSTATATASQTLTLQPTLPVSIASCIPDDVPRETALVVGIVDGDTIDVLVDGQVVRVRYIGIDTPERGETLFNQAAAYNQTLVYNKTVTLVKDQSETDRFDRLLRYVIAGDTFVNDELVDQGYAGASVYPPDTACADDFAAAQRQAQSAGRGLWMPTPVPFIPLPTSGGGSNAGSCHPSYPGVCIPPPPPDLDCPQISYRDFTVLPPDPHGFDGNHDGVGCES